LLFVILDGLFSLKKLVCFTFDIGIAAGIIGIRLFVLPV
jgi:hypothetical protein